MNKNLSELTVRQKKEIFFISLMVIFLLCRAAIPFLKYLFILFYTGFLVYSFIFSKDRIIKMLKEYILNFYLAIILVGLFILCGILSDKLYVVVFKDSVNMIVLLSIFFILTIFISEKAAFIRFYSSLINLTIISAVVISILNLFDLFNILTFNNYFPKIDFLRNSFADSLLTDYNFALLPIFFGLFSVIFYFNSSTSKSQKVLYNIILFIFLLQILFSGSRRGVILLFIICIILFFLTIASFIKRFNFLRNLASNSVFFLIEFSTILLFSYLFVFHSSFQFKNTTLKLLGINNASIVKSNISSRMLRYVSTLNHQISLFDLNKLIWSFDPNDPDSGWGKGNYVRVFPLTGKNVEIVPSGSAGYLLDSTSGGQISGQNFCFVTKIGNDEVISSNVQTASVFCFVSEDYNGDLVSILSEGSTFGNREDKYNLNKKGVWQKLNISVNCLKGDASVYLVFSKFGVQSFSKLKGYVIFAYPQYKINRIVNSNGLSDNNLFQFNIYKTSSLINIEKGIFNKEPQKITELTKANIVSDYYIKRNKVLTNKPLLITQSRTYACYSLGLISKDFLSFPLSVFNTTATILNDNDPIRKWINKLVSEDTTFHECKSNIVLDSMSNRFLDLRIVRWEFAWKIFTKEYNWAKKLFGGGFNYLNWYGYYFNGDKTMSDYPHNPFLSILLYSGLFGLIVYIIFVFKVFSFYIRYLKEYKNLFAYFVITFFFSFFSAGNPFDPPIMGFFVILPFFIHSIHKKTDPELIQFTNI